MAQIVPFPSLIDVTHRDLEDGLQSGHFTNVDLTTVLAPSIKRCVASAYWARIGEVNDTVHAVTETNPDALDIAARLDDERANGNVRGERTRMISIPRRYRVYRATSQRVIQTLFTERESGSLLTSLTKPRAETWTSKSMPSTRDRGAELIERTVAADKDALRTAEMQVFGADFTANLAAYLSKLHPHPERPTTPHAGPSRKSLPRAQHRALGPDQALGDQGWDNTDPRFEPVYRHLLERGGTQGLLVALERDTPTAVALPTSLAPIWAAIVGAPIVTVPMGLYPATAPVQVRDDLDTGP
ncbi:Glutamyl-tRNA amidotransferase subunit a [Tolypocladium paradoxum]|uniref:Glutamyl-tRNA amidotransferase subunit a n=1 Tax=Tolypocladium paradoxum TaxID=94208 RepID=A0A2S4L7M9_9HYPO|nr:Glutamyl-tRNA amidotransferase subunit a [Tolypocladium paradoxum]